MTGRSKMMIGWTVLVLGPFLFFMVVFSMMESYALKQNNPDDGITLSQFVVNLIHAWPPLVAVVFLAIGLTMGLLISHFQWVWVPEQKRATCGQCGKTVLLT